MHDRRSPPSSPLTGSASHGRRWSLLQSDDWPIFPGRSQIIENWIFHDDKKYIFQFTWNALHVFSPHLVTLPQLELFGFEIGREYRRRPRRGVQAVAVILRAWSESVYPSAGEGRVESDKGIQAGIRGKRDC